MKNLWQTDRYTIGIFDENNYFVADNASAKTDKRTGKVSYNKIRYYNSLADASESVARLQANKDADSLYSWLSSYRSWLETFRSLFLADGGVPSIESNNTNLLNQITKGE